MVILRVWIPKIQAFDLTAGAMLVNFVNLKTRVGSGVLGTTAIKGMNASDITKPIKVAFKTKKVCTKKPWSLLRSSWLVD